MRIHSLIIIATFLTALPLNGRILSPEEALSQVGLTSVTNTLNAPTTMDARLPMTLEMTVRDTATDLPMVYTFTDSDGRFLIVSASDAVDPLLGYGYAASDSITMPPSVKAWLDGYVAQIALVESSDAQDDGSSRPDREDISPLLTTHWNQNEPYNNHCPEIDGELTITGCAATAMAQIMNYHKWPVTGTGENSYTWNDQTLSLDFSEISFDWNNMLDSYSASATEEQCAAVADLMYACGISLNTIYGIEGSSAYGFDVATALIKYFGYNPGLSAEIRSYYTTEDWETMIYNDLKNSGPILYMGCPDNYYYGHAFVCDGYQGDGYFHINWGWGGAYDGYFRLSALSPYYTDIKGNTSQYNMDQIAIIGATKDNGQIPNEPIIHCSYVMTASASADDVTLTGVFANWKVTPLTALLGIRAVNAETEEQTTLQSDTYKTFQPGNEVYEYTVNISDLDNGTYRLYPIYIDEDGNTHDVAMIKLQAGYILMDKTDQVNVEVPFAGKIEVSEIELNTPLYRDAAFKISASAVTDITTGLYAGLAPVIVDDNGDIVGAGCTMMTDIRTSKTPIEYTGQWESVPESGDYRLGFAVSYFTVHNPDAPDLDNAMGISYTIISELQPITVGDDAASPELIVNSWDISIGDDDITATVSVTCETGYFADQIYLAIFDENYDNIALFDSQTLFLAEGGTTDTTISGSFSCETGAKYSAALFYYLNDDWYQITALKDFAIGEYVLVADSWSINGDTSDIDKNDISVTVTITCEGGDYSGQISFYIFPDKTSDYIGKFSSPILSIKDGETTEITFNGSFESGESGTTYLAALYYTNIFGKRKKLSSGQYFTIGESSSVSDIRADDETAVPVYYTIQGRRIPDGTELVPGVYIRRTGSTVEKILVH